MTMTAPPGTTVLPPDSLGVRCLAFRALGTECQVKFRQEDDRAALKFAAEVLEWIGGFEAKFSRFRPDSLVSRINAAAGREWVETDPEMEQLLDIADGLHRRTEGILDPTLLPLLRVWDWKTVHKKLPGDSEIASAMAVTGWEKVQRRNGAIHLPEAGMGLDFGGFGKEFAVDAVVAIARRHGLKDALVDLGRDVFALGGNGAHPFWHIGLEDGNNPGRCWAGLALSDRAVSASGNYARQFTHAGVTYGHILDPRTGWPVAHDMKAVNVIAFSCLEAGIYSTAIFVLGTKKGLELVSRCYGVAVCTQTSRGIDGTQDFGRWLVQGA